MNLTLSGNIFLSASVRRFCLSSLIAPVHLHSVLNVNTFSSPDLSLSVSHPGFLLILVLDIMPSLQDMNQTPYKQQKMSWLDYTAVHRLKTFRADWAPGFNMWPLNRIWMLLNLLSKLWMWWVLFDHRGIYSTSVAPVCLKYIYIRSMWLCMGIEAGVYGKLKAEYDIVANWAANKVRLKRSETKGYRCGLHLPSVFSADLPRWKWKKFNVHLCRKLKIMNHTPSRIYAHIWSLTRRTIVNHWIIFVRKTLNTQGLFHTSYVGDIYFASFTLLSILKIWKNL